MTRPPSYTETYLALTSPIAALLVLPIAIAIIVTAVMVAWVVGRWGSL